MNTKEKRILILKKLNDFTKNIKFNIFSRKNWGYSISTALEQLQKEYPKELFYPHYYIEFGEIKTYKFLFFNCYKTNILIYNEDENIIIKEIVFQNHFRKEPIITIKYK